MFRLFEDNLIYYNVNLHANYLIIFHIVYILIPLKDVNLKMKNNL